MKLTKKRYLLIAFIAIPLLYFSDQQDFVDSNKEIDLMATELSARVAKKSSREDIDKPFIQYMGFIDGRHLFNTTCGHRSLVSNNSYRILNSPYNLTGLGLTAGVWDAARALDIHEDFLDETETTRINLADGTTYHWHSSHVSGIIAGAGKGGLTYTTDDGTFTVTSEGSAPNATIDSFDWGSDLVEMRERATHYSGLGLPFVSNHSYSATCGWSGSYWYGSWGDIEDSLFGLYGNTTREYDQLTVDFPYYLIVKAAGNDRDDHAPSTGSNVKYYDPDDPTSDANGWVTIVYDPAIHPGADYAIDNGYDTIPLRGVAKNLICVGNNKDSVDLVEDTIRDIFLETELMHPQSGWGPTDDGRIKPDLVANGAGVVAAGGSSAATTTLYKKLTGTSMASPGVAGIVLQLQEHANNIFTNYLKASTIKGVLLHTADDMGRKGPDYCNGWGLVNGEAAVVLLTKQSENPSDTIVSDETLSNSQTITKLVAWDGESPLKATICWTDPAGPARSTLDDSTPVLVNNLDLKVTAPDDTTIYNPWVLDPANPELPATTGVNNLDNVEQVYIESPTQAGIWTIEITHQGTLAADQDFALIVTGTSNLAYANPELNIWFQQDASSNRLDWRLNTNDAIRYFLVSRWTGSEWEVLNDVYYDGNDRYSFIDDSATFNEYASADYRVEIIYDSGSEVTRDESSSFNPDLELELLTIQPGWNMVSSPYEDVSDLLSVDFAAGDLWSWDSVNEVYVTASEVDSLQGLWLYSSLEESKIYQLAGLENSNLTRTFQPGWNMYGSYSEGALSSGSIDSIFGWDPLNGLYTTIVVGSDDLIPTNCYWFYYNEETQGDIDLP